MTCTALESITALTAVDLNRVEPAGTATGELASTGVDETGGPQPGPRYGSSRGSGRQRSGERSNDALPNDCYYSMMRLKLIRHGQTVDNVNGALGTSVPGPGLTDLGLLQAAAIPSSLESDRIDAIYVSSMIRTHITAEPLAAARGVPIIEIAGLHEITAGDLVNRTDREAIDLYRGTIFGWPADPSLRLPGGESGLEFLHRFDRALREITEAWTTEPDASLVIVSHGAAIRAWVLSNAQNVDADFSREHPLANTACIDLEGSTEEGWTVSAWAGEPLGGSVLGDATAADPTSSMS